MVRSYQRRADRPPADRQMRIRYEKREEIDAEKVAEILIRIALRQADQDSVAGRAGGYLRDLLTGQR